MKSKEFQDYRHRVWPEKFDAFAPHALNAEARRDRVKFLMVQLKLRRLDAAVIAKVPELYQLPDPN